jgi:hypothetical protein
MRKQIDDYEKDIIKIFSQIIKDEDFAYYYEMTIIRDNYIKRIRDKLNQLQK